MIIISHRGYWKKPEEKNTVHAFSQSFELQFGTETDVRDFRNELVISHDMPKGCEIRLSQFLFLLNKKSLPLALNIKADGLAESIKNVMKSYNRDNWFVFDMSIPDMRMHLSAGNPVYARVSEVEPEPAYYDQIQGIWLDAFENDGWQIKSIQKYLKDDKRVCLVSPELHKRDHLEFWEKLRKSKFVNDDRLTLCTDFPEEAKEFFKRK